ncbi:LysR family transcriptional regulator [Catenovulum sp. 2E275]|uniref:LysR family transcriptional regulator n=1 Tax=Catenovulum sp. 2E275 TaxID=2980497 RepID=UPI0021D1F2D8|nr:LysR family transcriptional regulator [Catenovulum sp. 2E275]MCU4677028.1 LysR family transcriptional regulator [Catenovulum sp. 2E275]
MTAMPLSIQNIISRLTFRQLQVFHAVFKLQSYTKAGDLLGLTQPAVSSQIRQLEQALGQPLFEYVGRRLFCTSAGKRLAQSVDSIFSELKLLQSDFAALKGQVAGELKLLAVSTAQYVVPHLLREFRDLYPQIALSVTVVNRATALQRLASNSDDLVIMGMVPNDKPFTALPFLDNELVPVAPAEHALFAYKKVTATDFLNSQLLVREPGSGSRLALEKHCQQHRLKVAPAMELGSNEAIKHAVIAGLGVAVLPKLSVLLELELGKLKIVNVDTFPLNHNWSVVYPQTKYLTPAMQAFLFFVEHNAQSFIQKLTGNL